MKRKVMQGCVLILTVSLLICGFLCGAIFDLKLTQGAKSSLAQLVTVMARGFDPEQDQNAQAARFAQEAGGVRVTIIAPDGVVTGDSVVDFTTMENHLDRAEIKEARGTNTAVGVRSSATLGKKLLYAVSRTENGYFIRIASLHNGFIRDMLSFAPAILLAAALALAASLAFAGWFSRSISQPIVALNESLTGVRDGSTRLDADAYPYVELRDMASKINGLSDEIALQIQTLQTERDKIGYILDNMAEGLVLLDERRTVLLINNSACRLMGCGKGVTGKNLLYATRAAELVKGLERVAKEKAPYSVDWETGGKTVEANMSSVQERDGANRGYIITLSDVTESRQAVKARRDFFSNASHELNTPITSIRGFAELLQADIPLEEEQRGEIIERICKESGRMSRLIADIIMISRLESGDIADDTAPTDFSQVVRECCGQADSLARKQDVSLHLDIMPGAVVTAGRNDLHSLASNLIVNAVKYNKPGGSVDILLKSTDKGLLFAVRNDGEPIPIEDQGRIFERFYRINKGRNKKIGGTGLGLSIVKHVVEKMHGTLQLRSDDKNGTLITVFLPKV